MVKDTLLNAGLHEPLHPLFPAAFQFLRNFDASLPDGRCELDGDRLFAMVQSYETASPAGRKFEAHRRYIDIQYIVEGNETMAALPVERLAISTPYSEEKDFLLFEKPDFDYPLMEFHPGDFAVYFPPDAHMPGCVLRSPERVRKIVVKVACQ